MLNLFYPCVPLWAVLGDHFLANSAIHCLKVIPGDFPPAYNLAFRCNMEHKKKSHMDAATRVHAGYRGRRTSLHLSSQVPLGGTSSNSSGVWLKNIFARIAIILLTPSKKFA
jgi:hypothetical protein